MKSRRVAVLYILVVVLPTLFGLVLLFQGCEKKGILRSSRAQSDHDKQFAAHSGKISQLESALLKQERTLAEQERKITELSGDFSRQEKNVLDHGKKLLDVQEMNRRLDRMDSKLAAIEKGQSAVISEPDMSRLEELIKEQISRHVKRAEAPKIGVVNVQQVFLTCKRNEKYMKDALAERQALESELTELLEQIEADETGLKKLKPGSIDRIDGVREVLDKRARYQAKKEFYKLQIELKDQRWSEQLYKDILRIIQEVAAEKELAFVLEKSDPELPATSAEELRLIIRTHKVLYSGVTIDISGDVLARLDAEDGGRTK